MPPETQPQQRQISDQYATLSENAEQPAPASSFWRDARPTNQNPNFVRDYFLSSRLHFIGSFRARYESMMVSVGKRLNVHPSVLLRPPPKHSTGTERVIVHIDMDCFFASIAVSKDPELRGKCIAVCHGGGEISSCSYEARAHGVRAGMFAKNARKICPELLSVPYDFPTYESVSIQIYSFFHDYPGICVEAVSVDEAYLDITETIGKDKSQSTADTLVLNLRSRIVMETGCTASAGIGPSKLVARLATKGAKPNGQLRVNQEDVIKYIDTLSVKDLPGIGWRTSKKLAERGVTTVPQLRAISLAQLQHDFGDRQGRVFHDLARALDSRPVDPLKPRKSIGAEASWGVRFESNETDKARNFIQDIADEVATRVTAAGAYGAKVTYKVYRKIPNSDMTGWKHLGHGPCTILSKSAKLPTRCVGDAFRAALRETCLRIHEGWGIRNEEFRGVGLQVNDLTFADLNFNHSTAPVKGTRRIDTFFPAVEQNLHSDARDKDDSAVDDILNEIQPATHKTVRGKLEPQVATNRSKNGSPNRGIQDRYEKSTQRNQRSHVAAPRTAGEGEEEEVQRGSREEGTNLTNRDAEERANKTAEQTPKVAEIPEGWDRLVFEALPKELQSELLSKKDRVVVSPVPEKNCSSVQSDAEDGDELFERERKRKRETHGTRRLRAPPVQKRSRRKQSAQVTMTQFADISELRKTGHEILHADEFREKPLKEMVELLGDLKPRRREVKKLTFRKPQDVDIRRGEREVDGQGRQNGQEKEGNMEIPSPPSLSSDSEGSYGIAGAVERQGVEHSRVYSEEDIWSYAPKVKAWMAMNADAIRSGHMELLRGRILEFVQAKELDRACVELRTIRKFAEEDGLEGWRARFNDLLEDVQSEAMRLYGFRLFVRRLNVLRARE